MHWSCMSIYSWRETINMNVGVNQNKGFSILPHLQGKGYKNWLVRIHKVIVVLSSTLYDTTPVLVVAMRQGQFFSDSRSHHQVAVHSKNAT